MSSNLTHGEENKPEKSESLPKDPCEPSRARAPPLISALSLEPTGHHACGSTAPYWCSLE